MFQRIKSEHDNQSVNIYLYIPFKRGELSKLFLKEVEDFYQKELDHHLMQSIDQSCRDSDSSFKSKNFILLQHGECKLANLPKNSKIFVLGHGINISPDKTKNAILNDITVIPYEDLQCLPFEDWAYSVFGGEVITIDEVAQRMIADGLLGSDDLTIKLWFCDPNCKARAIADRFVKNFSEYENYFKVDYYLNKNLVTRRTINNQTHKWGKDKDSQTFIRASSIRGSLFTNPPLKEVIVESEMSKKDKKTYGIVAI